MLINCQQRITHESLIMPITNNSLSECAKSVFNEWGSMWDLIIEFNYHQYQKTLLSNFTLVHFKCCRFVIEVASPNTKQGPSWSWSHGSWIYDYLCNHCLSPVTFWVRISFWGCILDTTLCDKVCHGNFWRVAKQYFHKSPLTSPRSVPTSLRCLQLLYVRSLKEKSLLPLIWK